MINKLHTILTVVALSTFISSAQAANDDFKLCRKVFANDTPPVMQHQANMQSRPLCFDAFAVMHSGKSHTPIYVAERLNSYVLQEAKHDTGALYDCLAPTKNGLTKVGEWQKYHITFKGNLLTIELNGEKVLEANLDDWKEAHKNPDGSPNKFNIAYKDMAKEGHIGLQFHGDPITYRNVKIKPITEPKAAK